MIRPDTGHHHSREIFIGLEMKWENPYEYDVIRFVALEMHRLLVLDPI